MSEPQIWRLLMMQPFDAPATRVKHVLPFICFAALLALILAPDAAQAQSASTAPSAQTMADSLVAASGPKKAIIDTGSTAWMLVSSALVLFMVPGLALFYGGMVRAKNVLN